MLVGSVRFGPACPMQMESHRLFPEVKVHWTCLPCFTLPPRQVCMYVWTIQQMRQAKRTRCGRWTVSRRHCCRDRIGHELARHHSRQNPAGIGDRPQIELATRRLEGLVETPSPAHALQGQ